MKDETISDLVLMRLGVKRDDLASTKESIRLLARAMRRRPLFMIFGTAKDALAWALRT